MLPILLNLSVLVFIELDLLLNYLIEMNRIKQIHNWSEMVLLEKKKGFFLVSKVFLLKIRIKLKISTSLSFQIKNWYVILQYNIFWDKMLKFLVFLNFSKINCEFKWNDLVLSLSFQSNSINLQINNSFVPIY